MRLLSLACLVLLVCTAASAESKNPSDYPLRIHIFGQQQTTFYHNRVEEEAKGDGRANLFENGSAHAVNFSYECSEKVRSSFGYETYPAKWKKPGQELVVLIPVFGKAGSYFTCNFKTDVKAFTYAASRNGVISVPAEQYKDWMVKHGYDPEHGKDTPLRIPGETAAEPAGPPQEARPIAPAN